MLDAARMRRLDLSRVPRGQIAVGGLVLRLDYRFPRRTEIDIQGIDRIPRDRSVFFALNHTDAFNYWPFQYQMWRHGGLPYTTVWVKGKYYQRRLMACFFDATNNIPLPSRGFVLTQDFRRRTGRLPGDDEYRWLRGAVDGALDDRTPPTPEVAGLVGGPRPSAADIARFRAAFEQGFAGMMAEVTRLTKRAFELGLNVLVFPQGTRSKRLPRGLTGLAQMSQHLGATIVPVGSNGSDRLYPTFSPFSKGGRVVYRVGEPIEPDGPELACHRVREDFVPFSASAGERHGAAFRAITDIVMDRINDLLDPEYQAAPDGHSDGVQGVERFA